MEEMVEDGMRQRKQSKLYKAESAAFVNSQLASLINRTTRELADISASPEVSLRNVEEVKRRTILYMKACEEACVFPSIMGLSRSMGLSRQAVYDCMWRKSPPDTAAWLELCRDTFSDILSESNCNSIVSIFLQKAVYGLRESVEVVARSEPTQGEYPSYEEIAAKYADLPDDWHAHIMEIK